MRFFLSTKKNIDCTDAGIYLRQDNLVKSRPNPWDDFGHVMLFHIVVKSNEGKEQELGYSRVLINGEDNSFEYFIKNGIFIPNGDVYEITNLLTKNKVVSLPEKISFYKALHNVFSRNDVRAFLSGICDASYNKNMHEKYLLWDGYKGALFRDSTSIDGILNTGKQIALGRNISDRHIIFNISNPPEGMDGIEFSFSKEIVDNIEPQHINLVIGKNGLGKTFLLKYISDIISGIQDNDDTPYFNKLLVVAFSPFEEFDTKKDVERKLIEKYYFDKLDNHASIQMDVNEYEYIGFRDNDGNFDRNQPKKNTTRYFVESIKLDNDEWWEEDKRIDLLLKTLRIAIDFNELLFQSIDGETIFLKDAVAKDSIYLEKIDLEKEIRFIKNGQEIKLSSGQRIFSYMIPGIVSGITEKSLLIIDEPELYLHPTLEIALVRMLKNILAHKNSYAIIATHSAIIAREVKREYVHTLRGNLQNVRVAHPEIETLGESLDEIIGEIFDDYNTIKPYQNTIKGIFEKNESKKIKSQQSLFLEMKHKVGDDALIYLADLMDDPNDEFFIAGEK